jgi:hypothetical protein
LQKNAPAFARAGRGHEAAILPARPRRTGGD